MELRVERMESVIAAESAWYYAGYVCGCVVKAIFG